jgi:hypothetical protein
MVAFGYYTIKGKISPWKEDGREKSPLPSAEGIPP